MTLLTVEGIFPERPSISKNRFQNIVSQILNRFFSFQNDGHIIQRQRLQQQQQRRL